MQSGEDRGVKRDNSKHDGTAKLAKAKREVSETPKSVPIE
jgi:hypothetical protein